MAEMELLKQLEEDRDFQNLEKRLQTTKFNVFDVLRISDSEIRHSNVLAWLLDSRGSHGLGEHFLRAAIGSISPDTAKKLPDLSAPQIYRELENMDIVVDLKELVLLFENKINHYETEGQLVRYMERLPELFPKAKQHLFIFLTLAGDTVLDKRAQTTYMTWSHADVLRILTTKSFQDSFSQSCRPFIKDYCEMLRRLTMEKEVIHECKRLYLRHKKTIDLIIKHGMVSIKAACIRELKNHGVFRIFPSMNFWCPFVPETVIKMAGPGKLNWENFPACLYIGYEDEDSDRFVFEIAVRSKETEMGKVGIFETAFDRKAVWEPRCGGYHYLTLKEETIEIEDTSKAIQTAEKWIADGGDIFATFTRAFKDAFGTA